MLWMQGTDNASDYFNRRICLRWNGNGGTDTANITITIIGVNDTPTAVNDFGVVTEDATITITNGESRNLSGSYDTHDEHSGDILSNDTDPDASPTHTITAVRIGSTAGSGTAGTVGSALTGTYGQLTLNANGSYSYTANQDAADALDVVILFLIILITRWTMSMMLLYCCYKNLYIRC